jgi:hypothetical protein
VVNQYSFGAIAFDVPASWDVREVDGSVEIVDEQAEGAIHISLVNRSLASAPTEADARLLVENFADNNVLVADGVLSANASMQEARADGLFHPSAPDAETPLFWMLASVVWRDKAVRASYCTDTIRKEGLAMVKEIIRSIHRK